MKKLLMMGLGAIVIGLLLLLLTGWVMIVKVQGDSMEPTLQNGSVLIVSPSWYRLVDPKRGDIIWFEDPERIYEPGISRLIGLPGERLAIRKGFVFINGLKLDEPYLLNQGLTNVMSQTEWEERKNRFPHDTRPFLFSGEEQTLPPDQYFVLVDKRYAGRDSRTFGPIKRQVMNAKLLFRIW